MTPGWTWIFEVVGGTKMKWEMHRGSGQLLEVWTPVGSLPEELGSQVTAGEGRRAGL